jgi:ribonuclease BN (tRNA processing enzyme)
MTQLDPTALAQAYLHPGHRVLVFGEKGTGKSTLCAELADASSRLGQNCRVLSLNPGSPAFGPPAAVSCGVRRDGEWHVVDFEAVCTLDAARFRLPLVIAIERLVARAGAGCLLVDAAGVSRGMAGAELLHAVTRAASVDTVLAVSRDGDAALSDELATCGAETVRVAAPAAARSPSKQERAHRRTALWDVHLAGGKSRHIDTRVVKVIGAPPPVDAPDAWPGRIVALLDEGGSTLALGEVVSRVGERVEVLSPAFAPEAVRAMLVRDARRLASGLVGTSPAPGRFADDVEFGASATSDMVPAERSNGFDDPIIAHVASAKAALVSGIFGDPLLHVRLRHSRRSLLFDLGETTRLQARIAHQVTDVFLSHAHVDHIAGFLWLMRTRIGVEGTCRIWGPPGVAAHIVALIGGIEWDRVGDRGPAFEITEVDGERHTTCRVQAGKGEPEWLDASTSTGGLLLEDRRFRVRAATLDHGIPVLAFSLEEPRQLNVRKDRLLAGRLTPGPWLETLKANVLNGGLDEPVRTPDGTERSSGELAGELLLERPGDKLVYATDLDDTVQNRAELVALARGAHTFFCETAFVEEARDQARSTQHLTARAAGEIAAAAGVGRLVPFHLSRRYDREPERVYAELLAAFPRTVVPPVVRARLT